MSSNVSHSHAGCLLWSIETGGGRLWVR